MINENYIQFKVIVLLYILFYNNYNSLNINLEIVNNYDNNNKFVIFIKKVNISTGGLMAYYYLYLGCVNDYLLNGYIPLIDLSSHPNIFNGFNTSINKNPWESFFYQPFGYTLENVKKKAINIEFIECNKGYKGPDFYNIFHNNVVRKYWNNIANKYIPIKDEINKQAKRVYRSLFKNCRNILGVLIRGTDYIAKKPHNHSIQPTPQMVIKDILEMDNKYKYNWIFIATEDDLIREKFILKFGIKLKYFLFSFYL